MKDKGKTKVELIKELKTLRKERGKSALNNITERKQIERREGQPVTEMNFLYKTALDFIQFDPKDDIYRFIGKKLKEIVGDSIVLVNPYDKASDSFHVRALEGVREKIKKALKIIGKDLFTTSFSINNEEARSQLISGELLKVPGSLYKLTFEQIPKNICHVLEKLFNVGEIYFSGFAREKELFGNIIIIMPKGTELNNREFINVFIKQAAIALQKKQAEEELRDSEEHLKILFDYAPDAYYIVDLKGKFIDGNKAAERMAGYKKEELIGKSFLKLKLISISDIPKAAKLLAKNVMGLPTGPDEFVLNRKDNSKVIVEILTHPVKIKGRTLVLGLARDITERKQAEENVKNAKDELQMIMDSVPAIITYKDTESKIIRANKTMANSLKMPVKDIVGKTTEELFPREQAEKMRKDDQEVIVSGKPKRDIIQPYTTPDGIKWLTTDKIPYKDKEGKVTGVIGLSKDITVQRESKEEVKQSYQRLKKTMDATIETMSKILEAKDPYTSGHQHRVCQLAVPLARELGLPPDKIEGIRIASLIHDIGKIGLPTEILSKPTRLTNIEFSLIKGHSQIGYDILKSIDFSYPIARIVLQHHERLDGSGYPNNLKGDEILLEAKIIGVADVVEAMSSHRPYRPALGIDKALEEIIQNKGILYDPEVVDACLRLFKEKRIKFE
jgi:PAS domain S-box-containing protein